jgi:hypothetical protein
MLIQTTGDAQAALLSLANDITNTETTQVPQIGVADGGIFGFLGINSPGSGNVQEAAISLLNQLAGYVQDEYGALAGEDRPLTAQEVAKMKLIRDQVVDARATVQSVISDLDWSFGQLVSDAVIAAGELADKTVQAVAKATGLNWTLVKIGGGVLALVLGYALYRRVRG